MNTVLLERFQTLKNAGLLPSPRGVSLAIMELTRKEDVSLHELAHTLESDPALMSRLIKLANSCQRTGARPVIAVMDAIRVLGLNAVRGVALGLSLMAQGQTSSCVGFDIGRFWSHNLACAVSMRVLAGLTHLIQADEAFTLGLLSRVGELGLVGMFPEDYSHLLQKPAESPATLLLRERQSFGFDHADLTSALLQDWGLPAGLVQAVTWHDLGSVASDINSPRFEGIARMLTLCATVAELCLAGAPERPALMNRLTILGQDFELLPEQLQYLGDEVIQDWCHWCAMLDIAGQEVPTFAEMLTQHGGNCLNTVNDGNDLQRMIDEIARLTQRVEEGRQRNLENEQRMELALSGSDLGMWDWHVPSNELTFDACWCAMLGYDVKELPPRPVTWQQLINPEDAARVHQALDAHVQGKSPIYESEYRLRHKDGHWVWVLDRGRVVSRDTAGVALRMVGTHSDISQRKQVEAELLRSNRELEQFSYSISHDMRQPLRMISSYMQLLQKSLGERMTPDEREYIGFAVEGAQRMDTMMLGLLDYSRVGRKGEPMRWVDSHALVNDALHFLKVSVDEAKAQVKLMGEWPQVFVSPDEMLRLLQNLLANAIKFRKPNQIPIISVTSKRDNKDWTLCVADNGIGMQTDQIGRLFQMFARLQPRSAFEGTGIGLALCRKIAEHHGGSIWAESHGDGQGSRFSVVLPLSVASEVNLV